MTEFFDYENLTWPEIAALPRDLPLILPLGWGYSLEQLGAALGNPPRLGLLPPIPFGWIGSGLAVPEPLLPDGMAGDEAVVHDLLQELQANHAVSDTTYGSARGLFGERGVVDLCGLCGYYSLLAMVMNVARTPLPDGVAPPLQP